MQYYDDAAGILRSIILSAIAPHRLSLPTMPMPAFSITPEQATSLSRASLTFDTPAGYAAASQTQHNSTRDFRHLRVNACPGNGRVV